MWLSWQKPKALACECMFLLRQISFTSDCSRWCTLVCISPSVHACLHFACVHSCTSVRVQFCPSTSVSVWRWGSACLRVVLAGCPALRGDKWMSVVVVQRADTQTAAHTWLIVSLLGLGPVWLWLGQGLPPTPACVCVWGRVRERQCWKTKRARGRKNVSSYFMSLSVTVLSY